MWRTSAIECPKTCAMDQGWEDCQCGCNADLMEGKTAAEVRCFLPSYCILVRGCWAHQQSQESFVVLHVEVGDENAPSRSWMEAMAAFGGVRRLVGLNPNSACTKFGCLP